MNSEQIREELKNLLDNSGEFQSVKRNATTIIDGIQRLSKENAQLRSDNERLSKSLVQTNERLETFNKRLANLGG